MKRIFCKIICVVILICVVSCFGNLKFSVTANEKNNSYNLIGKLNCDDEINLSTIKLNIYSFDVQNKNLISESELLTSTYADNSGQILVNQNISSCYVEVELLSLPFGYGIISDTLVYIENNLIVINILKIDKIVINNMETNDVEFYSDNDTKLLAIYSNEQLNNIDKIIYNESEVKEITSSEISELEVLSNTSMNVNTNINDTYALDSNMSNSILVNNIKFQFNVSIGNYTDIFKNNYNLVKQFVVESYLEFENLFNAIPYSEIIDNQKIINIKVASGPLESSKTEYGFDGLEISFFLSNETTYSLQYLNYVISHEMTHYFLLFLTKIGNFSSIDTTILDEGIAEFIAVYYILISENVSMEDIDQLIIERITIHFSTFLKNDNNKNRPKDEDGYGINYGYYYFSVDTYHLPDTYQMDTYKNKYSYFSFFLFLYEYYNDDLFDIINFMLDLYVEKLQSNTFGDNFLIEMFEYLEINNGQLENQSLNGLNYDVKELIEKFNMFLSFPSKYITSLPLTLLLMWDEIVFEEIENVYTGVLLTDAASVYDSRMYYDKSFSYRSRKFVAKSETDNDFLNEKFLKMYLRYYTDMGIQIVYKNESNEVTYLNQYYYYDESNSTTEYNSKNLMIYIPESTECIIYVYYLKSNDTCNESKVRFVNLTVAQDEINLSNSASSYIYKLNEGTIFKRLNFINGQYKISLSGDAPFKYVLYDENLNIITESISVESENQDNVVDLNYLTFNGIYYFTIKSIGFSNNVVQLNINKRTFTSTFLSNSSTTLNGTQYTINSVIQIKTNSYGLYNISCELANQEYEISIFIYEEGTLTRKYGKNFAGPLAIYYENTANIFLRSDKLYTIEITITSAIDISDNFMIGIKKYDDVEIGNESYRFFELNSSEQFGTGMVFKSLNNSTFTITIGYFQNTSNNIDVDVYICKLVWHSGIEVSQIVLNNANKSNFVNITLTAGEKIFICIDTIIENNFLIEVIKS